MGELSPLIERTLDELAPPRPGPDRWTEIERAAAARRRRFSRRSFISVALAPAAIAALIIVAVLAWPFSNGTQGTLLERAAAAIGDGPVLHAVIQSGWGGTEIDLATGAHTPIHGEEELWYDPQRGVHDITTFAGVVQGDSLYPPGRVQYLDKTLAFLATDYRKALKDGSARILGQDTIDGTAVYWIRVDTQMLPDVSDGKLHEWAHDVAIAKDTLKPVATRETRDGNVSPDGISHVLSVESLPAGTGDFAASPSASPAGMGVQLAPPTGSLTAGEAARGLGTTPVWAGNSIDGLQLSRTADATRKLRMPGASTWTTHSGITLFYGPNEGGGIGQPEPAGPYLRISETLQPDDAFQRGVRNYVPPEGRLLVFGDGNIGIMQSHGIHVFLEASNADMLVAAARSLVPRPG